MRAGVHALLHPGSDVEWCVEQVRRAASQRIAAHERRRARREGRSDRVAAAPMPMPSAEAPESAVPAEPPVFARATTEAVVALHS
jgi:hypothetical protein